MYEKFGKPFKDIAELKTSFFTENEKHLRRALEYNSLYTAQPERARCKICDLRLPGEYSFKKHGVPYVFCGRCGHLNGCHEDTDAFCEAVYTSREGKDYAANYTEETSEAYIKRRNAIYTPKAEFLIEVLRRQGEYPERLAFADMGGGAGYFVSAMQEFQIENVLGFEVGKAQVDLGNWMMPSAPLKLINLGDTTDLVRNLDVDVMTFIGVFEHLQNPRDILAAMKQNRRTKYFYFCVPMFAPCIFGEMVFPEVLPRQLSIGHTHLFTTSSINYFEQEFGLKCVGAWWFGTDIMDHYRSVQVSLAKSPELARMCNGWTQIFEDVLDDMQLVLDRARKCGQVHMVMKIRE